MIRMERIRFQKRKVRRSAKLIGAACATADAVTKAHALKYRIRREPFTSKLTTFVLKTDASFARADVAGGELDHFDIDSSGGLLHCMIDGKIAAGFLRRFRCRVLADAWK